MIEWITNGQVGDSNTPKISFGVTKKTKEQWEAVQDKGDGGKIVFLINDKTIWFGGEYFGLSSADATTLSSVSSDLDALKTQLGHNTDAWNTLKGNQETLAAGLLGLKNALEGEIGDTEYTGASLSAAIAALQTAMNSVLTSISVNGKTINSSNTSITLNGGDIAVSSQDSTKIDVALGNKVEITTDSTTRTNSGLSNLTATSLNTTSKIADAIEAAHGAAANASSAAGNKIAKSSGTTAVKATGASSSVTGITPASLEDGEDIAQAIEDTAVALIGTSEKWGSGESKTLGQLRTLIDTLTGTVTGMDTTTSARITNIINEIKQISDSDEGDFANTILDKLLTLMGYSSTTDSTGNTVSGGGGYYNVNTGVNNGSTYTNTIQGIIDALESYIDQKASDVTAAATGGAVTSVKATGATVTGTDAGNGKKKGDVELTIDSSTVTLKQALTGTGGATTAANSTIQQAIQDVNTIAGTANTNASLALQKLQWEIL